MNLKLCECGCGMPAPIATATHPKHGAVRGQPQRFIHGHATRGPTSWVADPDTGCWNWSGYVAPSGYGRLDRDGVKWLAHRWVYVQRVGAIPEGLTLDHLCRNRACVNPDHLEPVTAGENVLRGRGPTALNAEKTCCIHGHPFDEENTYLRDGRRYCRTCRRKRNRDWRAAA